MFAGVPLLAPMCARSAACRGWETEMPVAVANADHRPPRVAVLKTPQIINVPRSLAMESALTVNTNLTMCRGHWQVRVAYEFPAHAGPKSNVDVQQAGTDHCEDAAADGPVHGPSEVPDPCRRVLTGGPGGVQRCPDRSEENARGDHGKGRVREEDDDGDDAEERFSSWFGEDIDHDARYQVENSQFPFQGRA
jgi:hypothetical protein